MKFGSLGAAVAAIGMSFSVLPVHAEQITIEQYIEMVGDVFALGTICPDLDSREGAVKNFMYSNGITDELMSEKTGYWSFVKEAETAAFDRRKAMSVEQNCEDALRRYGENGTVIKGFLFKKAASSN